MLAHLLQRESQEGHESEYPEVPDGVLRALWHALSTDRVGRRDHTDIGVTLNTYTHLDLIDAEQELERMEREVKMSEKIERRKRRRKSVGE